MDKKTLDHLAKLCCLEINDEDKDNLLSQIWEIINFVWQLQEINVEWVEPLYTTTENKNLEPTIWIEESSNWLLFGNVNHKMKDNWIVIKSPIKW